jgi:hypothetical protein
MTGAGDGDEIDEFNLDEADDVAEEDADVADELEGGDVDGDPDDGDGAPVPPVGTDVQLDTSDPDPTAGASDIGGVSPGPGP